MRAVGFAESNVAAHSCTVCTGKLMLPATCPNWSYSLGVRTSINCKLGVLAMSVSSSWFEIFCMVSISSNRSIKETLMNVVSLSETRFGSDKKQNFNDG